MCVFLRWPSSVAKVSERLFHLRWIVSIPEYREPSAYMFLVRVCLDFLFW